MKTYRVHVREVTYANYFVTAQSEDEAKRKASNGDYDDYETMESNPDEVLSVEEWG